MPLKIAPQYTQRFGYWTAWKAINAAKGGQYQHDDDGIAYTIYFYDGPEVHLTTIYKGDVPDGVVAGYSQAQNDADKAEWLALYAAASNRALSPKAADGRARIAAEKSDASKANFFSHDWTDPTTWYTTAVRAVAELDSDDGAHTVYSLAHANVIDSFHGKIFSEDSLLDAAGHSYRVAVTVDGVAKVEVDPHTNTGDYAVNYATGKLTFGSAQDPAAEVLATYHYMVNSVFVVKPTAGRTLLINFAEVQFSADLEITDSVQFQPYGYVDYFAPQLMSGVPSGTLIPLGAPIVYKTIRDYQTEAVKAYPMYPAIGGSGWRGMTQPVLVLDWDYVAATMLSSAAGMEIRVSLVHDVPYGGSFATCSFYCTSESQ